MFILTCIQSIQILKHPNIPLKEVNFHISVVIVKGGDDTGKPEGPRRHFPIYEDRKTHRVRSVSPPPPCVSNKNSNIFFLIHPHGKQIAR